MTTQHDSPDELSDFAALMSHEHEFSDAEIEAERASRRTRRSRGLAATAIVVVLLLALCGGYVGWALTAPLESPVLTAETPQVAAPPAARISLPLDGASAISVAGADDYLGPAASGVWATSGTDEVRPIASLSKLITALVVLEAKPLASADDPGPTIVFDKADHDLYDKYYVMGATIAAMPTGSSLSEYDALATMLIPSASNYAEAISTWAFGSQSGFVRATRQWLDAHGLAATTIVEPTGISPRNTSTPSDLMQIAKLAAAHPVIARIAATPSLALPGPGRISTTNGLLGTDGVTGLKTGNLGEGSFCLLYTASIDAGTGTPLAVTGVVLGGATRQSVDQNVRATLASIRGGFHDVPVAARGQRVGSYATPWGATADIVIADDVSIFTWSDTPITVTMNTTTPTTYEDGEVIGSVTWAAGPNTVTADVVIAGSIAPPSEWWRLSHPLELGSPFGEPDPAR
jgi:serine-type D-Ala-D-Ala carboxypeptidase (penicillin-binding protein 5/6)